MNEKHLPKRLKIGKFRVSAEILSKAIIKEDPELLKQLKTIFTEVVILDAKFDFQRETVEFTSYHPRFRSIDIVQIITGQIPVYIFEFEEIANEQGNIEYGIILKEGI